MNELGSHRRFGQEELLAKVHLVQDQGTERFVTEGLEEAENEGETVVGQLVVGLLGPQLGLSKGFQAEKHPIIFVVQDEKIRIVTCSPSIQPNPDPIQHPGPLGWSFLKP